MRKSRMQKIIISSVFALLSLAAMAQSNVSNIRVQTMDHVLIIQYDLAVRADIEVFASFDGGVNFTGPLQHVTGEAGRGIEPGRDKIIIWNVRNELGAMDNPNTVVKVVSTNEAGASRLATQSFSGGINVIFVQTDKFHGVSPVVVANIIGEFKGFSAGIVNIFGELNGFSGGAVNIMDELNGFSGGAVNVAKKVRGVQFGLVNVKDNGGLQVGLVNINRKRENFKIMPIINF